MTGNDLPGSESFDQIECGGNRVESAFTFQLGKHDPKAFLPQGIRGDQCP